MLFMRGKAMSGAPIMIGTNQFAKPPISAGITMKKIMTRPCAVVNTLYMCLPAATGSPAPAINSAIKGKNCSPGSCSSMRMAPESADPITPAMMAKIRYIVPMSLWFVE